MPQARNRLTENQETVAYGAGSIHSELQERSLAARRRALSLNASENHRLARLCNQIDSQARSLCMTYRQEKSRLLENAKQLQMKIADGHKTDALHKTIIDENSKTDDAEDRRPDGLQGPRERTNTCKEQSDHYYVVGMNYIYHQSHVAMWVRCGSGESDSVGSDRDCEPDID